MKSFKSILVAGVVALTTMSGCKAKTEKPMGDDCRALVCYFSATGTTAAAADRLAKIAGADIFEIKPVELYTEADLDWRDSLSRSSVEMHNRDFRPAIVDSLPDLSSYDVVFIGYPNWWNTHPTLINTFIETVDLSGKKVVPFMTSGGSDIVNSESELAATYPGLTFAKGLLMNEVTDNEITDWLKSL